MNNDRIIKALLSGWSIGPLIIKGDGRISLWASKEISSGWKCYKAEPSGDVEEDVNNLLDEAGIPK